MNSSSKRNDNIPQYSKYFRSFLPISFYPQYSSELELSDRIILPKSVLLDISRLNLPSPYLFILKPERVYRSPIYCAPLYFTSEEDIIYLPMILLKRLGFKAFKHQKHQNNLKNGIYLQSLPLKPIDPAGFSNSLWYVLPRCQKVKVFVSRTLAIERIRRGLVNYSVLKEGEDIKLMEKKLFLFI
ncbi:unnamed protein product [Blepharisma stoltei]|uniref:Ubiquitin fusion degradation protein UFD1 N-terminal subdomain 1 domain-containing protein n=1 Tax=Blepharisma stoltei TaxID=1481888 RepID=A0AAU9IKA9_9CILI|nr:unnamed protein product [Blepharisma stoltei]